MSSGSHVPHRMRRFVALAAVGCLLAACSDSDKKSSGSTGTTAASPSTSTGSTSTGSTSTGSTTPDPVGGLGTFEKVSGVPGVTDTTINFAILATGPSNPLGYCLLDCYKAGVQAFFDYQNARGGVNGRKLVISRTVDDEVGNTQVKALELIDDSSIFGVMASPLLYSGFSDLGASGIPVYTTFPASGDVNGFDNMYIPNGTMCTTCSTPVSVNGAVVAHATKVAAIGFGVSQASKDCVDAAAANFKKYGPGAGIEIVYKNNELPFGFPNGLGPEVTAMKAAGVDYITTCIDQNSVLILEQELERQGMGDVVVALPQGYSDTKYVKDNAALLEGDIMGVSYRPVEADPGDSNIQVMLDAFKASGVQFNDYAFQGWFGAQLAAAGIVAAGPQFDRAKVVAATNQFTAWTNGGMTPPVDWSTAHDAPRDGDAVTMCTAYVRIHDGAFEMASDPAKPWQCFDLPMDAWAAPEERTFS